MTAGWRFAALAAGGGALALGLAAALWVWNRPAVPDPADPLDGRALYLAHCAVCHGPAGRGDGPGGRVIRQRLRDFSHPGAMREADDRFLAAIIRKGSSQFGRSNAMPAWGMKLSDDQIRALVAHIRSLAVSDSGPAPRKETP
jgi:mono/diheme cytochrome c family protein